MSTGKKTLKKPLPSLPPRHWVTGSRAALFSSAKTEWGTPDKLWKPLHAQWCFTLDVCALPENAKCKRYFTPEQDGLKQRWKGVCWGNFPYGPTIGLWMAKARLEAARGATVVCLVPARTDTKWWHDSVEPIRAGAIPGSVTFLKGRVKFVGAKKGAPFPSALVTYLPGSKGTPEQGFFAFGE